MTDDQPVVGGRYQLGTVLGRGGMAEVRRGIDIRLGRPVAIKRLSPELAADPTFQTRFQREAHAVASLNHPSIAAVFDSGEEVDEKTGISIPYIVMELVEGSTLRDVLRDGRRLLPERALELTRGVLEALGHSHAAGIIHRDIKPANVMLTPVGAIKVMDFGIARAATDTSTSLTQTASVIGTAQYLSPEQARGESVDLRSDIYSTGCLLYELLTGRPPFTGDSSVSVAYQHVREPPLPPSQLDPQLGPEMDAVTLKALAKDPADRYQSAAEMSADLGRILAGQTPLALGDPTGSALGATMVAAAAPTPVATRPAPVPVVTEASPSDEPPRRNVTRTVLIAAIALLMVSGLALGVSRLFASSGDELVSVPSVVGVSQASADSQLRELNLTSSVVSVHGPDDDTMNDVITQNPPGGTEIPAGSTVTIEVNVGPADAKIPSDLVGEDVDKAKKVLEKAGFTSVRTEKAADPPDDAKKGDVVSVDPDEGTSVALGEQITLTYVSDDKVKSTPKSSATADPTTSADPTRSSEPSESPSEDEPTKSSEPTKSADPPVSPEPEESTKPTESSETTDPQSSESTAPSESAQPAQLDQASPSSGDE